jgi:murein DD-endopeptidase MepM/ murein hydrolase activator NlpD
MHEPRGFPIDPSTQCGVASGPAGSRTIAWGAGPAADEYSRTEQPSDHADRANACGWNARTHVEYEGRAAVDWYIAEGTPVVSTMDGIATLIVYTVSNPFDVYGVDREPYLGNPDRARAPLSPFPGPGGGQGVAVHVENEVFRTEYAHLDVGRTLELVPADAFLERYAASFDYASMFAGFREFGVGAEIARWSVYRGDVLGISGDTGYSEAPHLHYAIVRVGTDERLCPTDEPGFEDGGWLFKPA